MGFERGQKVMCITREGGAHIKYGRSYTIRDHVHAKGYDTNGGKVWLDELGDDIFFLGVWFALIRPQPARKATNMSKSKPHYNFSQFAEKLISYKTSAPDATKAAILAKLSLRRSGFTIVSLIPESTIREVVEELDGVCDAGKERFFTYLGFAPPRPDKVYITFEITPAIGVECKAMQDFVNKTRKTAISSQLNGCGHSVPVTVSAKPPASGETQSWDLMWGVVEGRIDK